MVSFNVSSIFSWDNLNYIKENVTQLATRFSPFSHVEEQAQEQIQEQVQAEELPPEVSDVQAVARKMYLQLLNKLLHAPEAIRTIPAKDFVQVMKRDFKGFFDASETRAWAIRSEARSYISKSDQCLAHAKRTLPPAEFIKLVKEQFSHLLEEPKEEVAKLPEVEVVHQPIEQIPEIPDGGALHGDMIVDFDPFVDHVEEECVVQKRLPKWVNPEYKRVFGGRQKATKLAEPMNLFVTRETVLRKNQVYGILFGLLNQGISDCKGHKRTTCNSSKDGSVEETLHRITGFSLEEQSKLYFAVKNHTFRRRVSSLNALITRQAIDTLEDSLKQNLKQVFRCRATAQEKNDFRVVLSDAQRRDLGIRRMRVV